MKSVVLVLGRLRINDWLMVRHSQRLVSEVVLHLNILLVFIILDRVIVHKRSHLLLYEIFLELLWVHMVLELTESL